MPLQPDIFGGKFGGKFWIGFTGGIMALTNLEVAALVARDKSYRRADAKGLYIECYPNGSKHWRFKYRFGGQEKRLALGPYPAASLSAARDECDKLRALVKQGIDPARQRRLARLEGKVNAGATFGEIAADYIEAKYRRNGKAPTTIKKVEFLLSTLAPTLGSAPIGDIKAIELMAPLRALEAKGYRETARSARAFASRVFRHGISLGKCTDDPARLLSGALSAPVVRHTSALLDPKRVGEFLPAADAYQGQPVTRIAMLLLPHLMLRPSEMRLGQWDEIDFGAAVWHVPAERTKMRKAHSVPLSTQALALLRELQALTGSLGLMFRGQGTKGPISENTLNQAYKRLGFGGEVTAHGFRSTASSFLNETGKFNPDAIEKALAHKGDDATRAAYHRGEYWAERVGMAQWWSDYLDTMKSGAVVIPFEAGRKAS